MFINGNYVSVKGQHLNSYEEASGGSMTGGHNALSIERFNDKYALYTVEESTWYNEDPKVNEYLIDVKVLDDIQTIFTKYKMNFWNRKKFTNMFVTDGASYSYNFAFDSKSVYFSSQIYPLRYRSKLEKIDDAISAYTSDMKLLPGLIVPQAGGDYMKYIPAKGSVGIYVNQYSRNIISYKCVNDTEENVDYSYQPVIRCLSDGAVIYSSEKQKDATVYANSDNDGSIKLDQRLDVGIYELNIGEYSCTFEISQPTQ